MKRLPPSVLITALCGSMLGIWMAYEGLHLRLYGQTLSLFGAANGFWQVLATLNLEPQDAAWTSIVLGTAWAGIVCALLIRQGWSRRMGCILGSICLLFLGPGTVLGAVVLIFLNLPSTRSWLAATNSDGSA
ncbi:MAG TPA: hypothetical protein G4O08_02610 [Anaerolineae bacterium]|nr:hypothetical protein [Anaerolineae bacterium]